MENGKQTTIQSEAKHPTLTMVMPFFNHKELVAEMVDSIVANDYEDWELLAIDDGSQPEEHTFLKERYKDDKRISIIARNREPKGAQTCRNMGLEMARGTFIIFFDSDDYVAPYCLRNRVESMEKRPELDFMVFRSGTFNGGRFQVTASQDVCGYPVYKDDLTAFIERTLPFIVWNNIYRTEALRRHGLTWDTSILSYQDSDFNIQALLHGLKYDYATTQADYGYRTEGNGGSVSKKIPSERHRESHLYFLNKQYDEVQRMYGNRFNRNLYRCALYIYSISMSAGVDADFARRLSDIVKSHDRSRGIILKGKISLSVFLGKFMPVKLARQLPMPVYLVRKLWMYKAVPRHIRRLLHEGH